MSKDNNVSSPEEEMCLQDLLNQNQNNKTPKILQKKKKVVKEKNKGNSGDMMLNCFSQYEF